MSNITPGTLDARTMKNILVQESNLKYDNVALDVTKLSEYSEDWASSKRISQAVETARTAFQHGWTMPVDYRKVQIKQLIKMLEENIEEMVNAVKSDVGKPEFECKMTEIKMVLMDCTRVLNSLSSWTKSEKVDRSLSHIMSEHLIIRQPYGVVLVIGAWNFPILLVLQPLVGAIAAGNTVIMKPSEMCPKSGEILAKLIPKYLDKRCYHVVLGGVKETTELLKQRFNYIFFTGSPEVGKIIYKAATNYLVPVTLELGGKNPCYIDQTADMEATAQLIIAAKWYNNGQLCVCTDYILCTKEVQNKFIAVLDKALKHVYGSNPKNSPELGPMINDKHYERVAKILKDGTIALGGQTDASKRYIAPTVLINVKQNSDVMNEEIFGPILPIINVKNEEEAIKFINEREHALVIYVFTQCKETQQKFISWTHSGSLIFNDSANFMTSGALPFGGVGNSGFGAYHGKHSFETFSHKKSCLISRFNPIVNYVNRFQNPPLRTEKMFFGFGWLLFREIHFGHILFWFALFMVFLLGFSSGYILKTYMKDELMDDNDDSKI